MITIKITARRLFILVLLLAAATPLFIIAEDAFAQGPVRNPNAPAALAGNGFTYQGQLKNNSALVNGTCDFQFGLWDALAAGPQYGSTQTVSSLAVSNGLFTTVLDFGVAAPNNVFTGTARYLQSRVRCPAGSGSYTNLSPRQALTPAPYALALPGLYTTQNITGTNVIGGYNLNNVAAGVYGATISGGGGTADNLGSTCFSWENVVSASYGTIGGGMNNTVLVTGTYATIGGGRDNFASGIVSVIGGGTHNTASALFATVGGGSNNNATNDYATIGGGDNNDATNQYASIIGGNNNLASGYASMIGGGQNNISSGNSSFSAGTMAKATHDGAFVWGDNTAAYINSSAGNAFFVRANGGIWLGKATSEITPSIGAGNFISTSTGAKLTNAGVWTDVSDKNVKTNFEAVDGRLILSRLSSMPVTRWSYQVEDSSIRHIGPTAQDFYAAFKVGNDDTHLAALDTNGVALAAIQGLYQMAEEKGAEIQNLKSQNAKSQRELDALKQQTFALEARITALEQASASANPGSNSQQVMLGLGALLMLGVVYHQRKSNRGDQ